MSKDHGGPAFPIPMNPGEIYEYHGKADGMTLRDSFAIGALQTVSAYPAEDVSTWHADDFARHVYEIADAMLKERAK